MRTINVANRIWKIHGISLLPSDSIYLKLKDCIESGTLSEDEIRKFSGHMAPIEINKESAEITFFPW